jgi:Zn-finger nucleic acid-binding protein
MAELICPKCKGPMHTHKRNGVTIEQCRKCHGIFLDRGELEQLIGAESSFLGRDGSLGRGADVPQGNLRDLG